MADGSGECNHLRIAGAEQGSLRARLLRPMRIRPRLIGAAAAVLMIAATGLILLGGGILQARTWAVDSGQTLWIAGLDDGLPYRPAEGIQPRDLRDWSLDAPDTVQVSHDFQLTEGRQGAMTVLLPVVEGEATLFINGVPAEDGATLAGARYLALTGGRPVVWEAPEEILRPGRNRLDVIITGSRHRSLGTPVVLGPSDDIRDLYGSLSNLMDAFRAWLLVLSAVAAGLALAASAALRAPAPWIALSAAAAAVGARSVASDAVFQVWLGPFWSVLDQFALCVALLCLGCAFLNPRMEQPQGMRRWLWAGLGGLVLLTGLALFGAYRDSGVLKTAGMGLPLMGLAFLVWAGRQTLRRPGAGSVSVRTLEGAVLGLLAVTAVTAVVAGSGLGWGLWVPGLEAVYGIGVFTLLSGLVAPAGFLTGREIWHRVRDRPRLSRIIRSQQQEIEATALALQQQERRSAILEERQRLSRDMHDGIGGQLMSLLARVRSRRITPEQMEGELTSGLAELRLMVDSLDASDGPVADALAVLRSRIRTQTEAARMSLDWSQSEALTDIVGEPNWVLNLNRLIQEAVTNAVRHAKADHMSVAVEVIDDRRLSVTIRDNGIGFDKDRVRPGRGLSNLAFRAAQMGGAIEIGRDGVGGGAVVRAIVTIPQAQPTPPALGHQSSEDMMPS